MNYVLTIILYLLITAWLSYMAGDSIGTIIIARNKIINLARKKANNENITSVKEALNYCSDKQRTKYKRTYNRRLYVIVIIAILFIAIIIAIIESFFEWSSSQFITAIVLEVVVAYIIFNIGYKFAEFYLKDSYSAFITIKESENTELIYLSDGKKIVSIDRLIYEDDGSTKLEKLEVTQELIDFLKEKKGNEDYLLY